MTDLIGLDCALDCTKHAADLEAAGVHFVGRYYRWPSSKYKPLVHDEAVALTKAGLFAVAVWEWQSSEIANFSYHEGFDQGSSAYKQAMNVHQPAGTLIYFAVDSDFSAAQIAGPIADYFRGVSDAFSAISKGSSAYLIGVYGSGRTCDWLLNHGMTARSWLAVSSGWAGYNSFQNWDIKQGFEDLSVPGLKPGDKGDYDSDVSKSSFGGFQVLA